MIDSAPKITDSFRISEDQVKRLEDKQEEGFQSVGGRLSYLETNVGGLKEDVTILKIDMGILKTNVTFLNKFFWIVIASVIKEFFFS